MTRIAAITPAHRTYLRQLKADFDAAYAAIEDMSRRDSDSFLVADRLYRVWVKAIDGYALALLDDLDALDIGGLGSSQPAQEGRSGPAIEQVLPENVEHIFRDLSNALHVPELVGTPGDPVAERP